MSIVYVQGAMGRSDNTGNTVSTNSINTTAGNLLIGAVCFNINNGAQLTSLSDNDGTGINFTQDRLQDSGATVRTTVLSKAAASKTGYIATATVTTGNAYLGLTVTEVAGIATAALGHDQAASAAGLTVTTGALNTSSGQFALAVGTDAEQGTDGLTLDGAWTTERNTETLNPNQVACNIVVGHRIISSGNPAQTVTITHGNGSFPVCMIVTYLSVDRAGIKGLVNNHASLAAGVLQFERTQAFTIRFVFRCLDNGNVNVLMTNVLENGVFQGWENFINTDQTFWMRLINTVGSNWISRHGTTVVTDNAWRVAYSTYDGSSLAAGVNIYLNGVLETMVNEADTLSASIVTAGQKHLIASQDQRDATYYLRGALDSIMVWNAVKDQTYISANSALDVLPPVDGNTVLRLAFNEGNKLTAADTSGSGFNATLTSQDMWFPAPLGFGSITDLDTPLPLAALAMLAVSEKAFSRRRFLKALSGLIAKR